ncbi:MAG: choice-of-anchor D domain-containing protein [Spirochaetes bacterium]|nr:choice-of-anchor D domain-containing protein [Spirochaetota bacterium]
MKISQNLQEHKAISRLLGKKVKLILLISTLALLALSYLSTSCSEDLAKMIENETTTTTTLPKVAEPTFSIPTGTTFATSIIVDLSCSTKGATIKYSFDNEIWVTGKIVAVSSTKTLYVKATMDGMVDSDVVSATYICTAVATTTTTLGTGGTSTTIVGSTTTTDAYASTTSTTNASTSTSTTYVSSSTTSTSTTTTVTTTTIAGKEINIKYSGINVEDGTTDLNIGETIYGTPKDLVFTIENQGNQNIILSGTPTKVSLTGDCFSLKTDASASIILPGKSTTFTVLFDPTYNADIDTEWSASISIANDDANENPYNFTIKGMGVINPEVSVEYNSSIINDDAIDYTLTFPNGFTNDLKFTVKNIGVGNLLLTGSPRVTVSGSEFSLFQDASGIIADGEYSEFIVKFSPAGSGTYTGSISIANNDGDNNPYNFSFKIVLANYEPEINVKLNELNIADGSSNVDIGEILYDSTKDVTFTVENIGTADLYLVGNPIINFSGTCLTLIDTIDSPVIVPSGSASFTVRFAPNVSSGSAEYIGTVSILNSDTDEDTYNWTIKGRSIINPEMNVKDSAVNIPDGTANYDFGSVKYGDPKDITFTIENNGIGDLLLTGSPRVTVSGTGFTLKSDAVSIIGQESSSTFTVTFTPPSSYGGNYSGTISISNNDGDESPYNFSVIAEGVMNPEINVKEGINTIVSGTVQYDIGSTMYGSPKDITFNIENSGLSLLVLSGTPRVAVTGTGFSLKTDATANIAVGASSNFIVTFTPTADGGNYTADIVISNNDIDESVYTFTIKGTGLIAPEINVKLNGIDMPDGSTDIYYVNYILNQEYDISLTIENTGIGNLKLPGNPAVNILGDFCSLKTDSGSVINQGSYSTFVIAFNPLYEGEYDCNISINNNDSDESIYNIIVKIKTYKFVYGWTKTMGGASNDYGNSTTVDCLNNIYTTGYFEGTVDFDPGAGVDNKTSIGYTDIYITKNNSDGSYGWTKTIGGVYSDYGYSITVDSLNNIYLTGSFAVSAYFFDGVDIKTSYGSSYDIYITMINSDGTYGWTKTIGGVSSDYGYSITVDNLNNIYVTGYFKETVDFDPGAGIDNKTSAGNADIYITKINSDGSYGWTKTMGGLSSEYGNSITVDSSHNIYVTGYFEGTADFNPAVEVDNKTSVGGADIYITKINSDGSYGWTKTMGGVNDDFGYSIKADSLNNIYATGYFRGNIYITKINENGNYGWTKIIGGGYDDYGYSITVDNLNNIYVTGEFQKTVDFDPGEGVDNKTSGGINDIFITRINSNGSYGWTKTIGSTGTDYGYSITVDSSNNIYVTGEFGGTVDFNPGNEVDIRTRYGLIDIFILKFEQ